MKNKSKHRSPWGTSLRVLPWDKQDDEPTLTEKLISSTVTEWYEAKHRDPSEEEIKLINRAKWLLITCLNMTEDEAHRYISKLAMQQKRQKREIAESIIRTYSQ